MKKLFFVHLMDLQCNTLKRIEIKSVNHKNALRIAKSKFKNESEGKYVIYYREENSPIGLTKVVSIG
jgi:hypothetical protein